MTIFAAVGDTLTNFVAQLNSGKSKAAQDQFVFSPISQGEVEAMYRADWVSRKAVDAPVEDCLRQGREVKADARVIAALEAAYKRHEVEEKIDLALKWSRLYGGSGILIGDGSADFRQPLNVEAIKKGGIRYLTVLDRWSLKEQDRVRDATSPDFLKPSSFQLSGVEGPAVEVHPSRIIRIVHAKVPGVRTARADEWGDSLLQIIRSAVHHFALATQGTAELIHEAKIDVIKLKGLSDALSKPNGVDLLVKRFTNAAMLKSINNTLVLETGDEWDRKTTAFTGLPDLISTYLQIVAGATDIPVTRLAGTSPKGLNSTGDGDARNYYDMLASMQKRIVRPIYEALDAILLRDETGSAPPADMTFEFRPLWQPTAKERAETEKLEAETTAAHLATGLLPEDLLARGLANRLLESGFYPGVEDELAAVQSAANVASEDPDAEADGGPTGSGSDRNRRSGTR